MSAPDRVLAAQTYTPFADSPTGAEVGSRAWHPAAAMMFRVCFLYFGAYVILTQMLGSMVIIPGWEMPELGLLPPFRQLGFWVGAHVLGIAKPFDTATTGSGDRTFYWVQAFTLLVAATAGGAIWSILARGRTEHDRLYRWFRLFLRIAVGTSMLSYGFAKAVPLQMPQQLTRLVEPYGNFSMMGVLWASIGSSRGYEIFVGLAEVGAGTLLLIPRFARVGALLCLMDSVAVFTLNMTYDVPVKLFSFHLVLMSLFLLAPIARPLFDILVLGRVSRIPEEPAAGDRANVRRGLWVGQIAFTVYALTVQAVAARSAWHTYGGGSPRSPLYGVWEVRDMTIDGVAHAPLLTDTTRWRRIVFDAPQVAVFQRMDDQFRYFPVKFDSAKRVMTLTARDTSAGPSTLSYQRIDPAHLTLEGTMGGHAVHMALAFHNPNMFQQRSRGFSWVQEVPFNR